MRLFGADPLRVGHSEYKTRLVGFHSHLDIGSLSALIFQTGARSWAPRPSPTNSHISPVFLLSICDYDFDPENLYVMDESRRDAPGGYPTFSTLFQSLAVYFRVLVAFVASRSRAGSRAP